MKQRPTFSLSSLWVKQVGTALGVNLAALAMLVVVGIAVYRAQSALLGWPREGRRVLLTLLMTLPALHAPFVLGVLWLSYVTIRRMGLASEKRLRDSQTDRWNRRLVELLALWGFLLPTFQLEGLRIEGRAEAVVRGLVLGASTVLATRIYAVVQRDWRWRWYVPFQYLVVFLAFNILGFRDPNNQEWLAGAIMAGTIVASEWVLPRAKTSSRRL